MQNTKERIRRHWWPKLPIGERAAENISRVLFVLGPVLAYALVECLNHNNPFTSFGPLQIGLNLVWYYLGALFFYFVLGRRNTAVGTALVLAWAIGAANHYLIRFRGRTLFPGDLLTLRTAMNVAGNYDYTPDVPLVATGAAVLGFLLLLSLLPVKRGRRRWSWGCFVPALTASALFLGLFFGTNTVADLGISPDMWTTHGNGLALNFSLCLSYSRVTQPEGYSEEALSQTAAAFETEGTGEVKPHNVIVIMNEAFSDLGVIPGVETNRDCMPFIRSLKENTVKGTVYASVFGGTTANSEYEFLTGNTTAFLPAGTVPYHLYVSDDEPSMARQMKALGYHTIAMHPYYSSGWNRVAVYQDMGFDEQYFLHDFRYDHRPGSPDFIREYLSDQTDFENLVARYEQQKGEPLFLFNVTMQNHSAYSGEWTNLPKEVWLTGKFEGQFRTVDQYLNLIYQSDKAFQYLVEYFEQVDEPTVICMFGDHQPQVATNFYTEALGGEVDELPVDLVQKKQAIPFVIWANYDIPEQENVVSSINYLSTILTSAAGIPQTSYQRFLTQLSEDLPVINTAGYQDPQGNWVDKDDPQDLPAEGQKALNWYEVMEYNNIFDKKNRPQDFYTLAN